MTDSFQRVRIISVNASASSMTINSGASAILVDASPVGNQRRGFQGYLLYSKSSAIIDILIDGISTYPGYMNANSSFATSLLLTSEIQYVEAGHTLQMKITNDGASSTVFKGTIRYL